MKKKVLLNYRFRMAFYPFVFVSNKINWRMGRPYKCNSVNINSLHPLLQPGMVVLSHKDFEFTNLFIRGYWTHSAIVIDHAHIVEATSKGVELKRTNDFFISVDDFIVLKPSFCGSSEMEEACWYVKKVVGYPYNFTFLHGRKAFYCTELIYWAYMQACRDLPEYLEMDKKINGKILNPQVIYESQESWQTVACINSASHGCSCTDPIRLC
jgi:hypothetical protein